MLETKRTISLTGQSIINNGDHDTIVVSMTANISNDPTVNTNINQNIVNQDLYVANKEECRKDIDVFQLEVRAIEDSVKTPK